jgi:hypothetical protein
MLYPRREPGRWSEQTRSVVAKSSLFQPDHLVLTNCSLLGIHLPRFCTWNRDALRCNGYRDGNPPGRIPLIEGSPISTTTVCAFHVKAAGVIPHNAAPPYRDYDCSRKYVAAPVGASLKAIHPIEVPSGKRLGGELFSAKSSWPLISGAALRTSSLKSPRQKSFTTKGNLK